MFKIIKTIKKYLMGKPPSVHLPKMVVPSPKVQKTIKKLPTLKIVKFKPYFRSRR